MDANTLNYARVSTAEASQDTESEKTKKEV